MWGLIAGLAGEIVKGVTGHFKGKRQITESKVRIASKIATGDIDYDIKALESSDGSWKDEYWTIVLSIPLLIVGYAVLANDTALIDRVHQLFMVMDSLPQWYQYALYGAIASSFGLKGLVKFLNRSKK